MEFGITCSPLAWPEAVEVHFDAREIRESAHAASWFAIVVRIGVQKVARSGQKPRGAQTRANHVDHHFEPLSCARSSLAALLRAEGYRSRRFRRGRRTRLVK